MIFLENASVKYSLYIVIRFGNVSREHDVILKTTFPIDTQMFLFDLSAFWQVRSVDIITIPQHYRCSQRVLHF